jgi:hypothetical protein
MKKFLARLNFFNVLLQLSFTSKIVGSFVFGIFIFLLFIWIYTPEDDVKNALNSKAIMSIINIGNSRNEALLDSIDKNIDIENNAAWFKNENGQVGSVAVIKDVGGKWREKKFFIEIIGNGELVIKLSGHYDKYPIRSVIFVDYKDLKIGDKEFSTNLSGRNDKDTLVFETPVKDGQIIEISFAYKNVISYADIFKSNFVIFVFILFFICVYLFNTEKSSRIVCKITIWLLIISGVYFIMLSADFTRWVDAPFQLLNTTAIGNTLDFWNYKRPARFDPLALSRFNILTLFPYGFTAQAHYFLNSFLFALVVLLIVKILDFKSKQKVSSLYIKLFSIAAFIFTSNQILYVFSHTVFNEVEIAFLLALFLFVYKKSLCLSLVNKDLPFDESEQWITKTTAKKILLAIAAVCAIFATYCKEPTFTIFFTIALLNFLFARKNMDKTDRIFSFVLIVNAIVFLVLYYFLSFRFASVLYDGIGTDEKTILFADRLIPFLETPILVLIVVFALVRVYFILFKKDKLHVFYDGLLFGAFIHFLSFEMLGIFLGYYFLPAVIVFLPAGVWYTLYLYDTKKYFIVFLIGLFIVIASTMSDRSLKARFAYAYNAARYNIYNVLKIDMMSKHGDIIVDDVTGSYTKGMGSILLRYINTSYFQTKSLDETEISNSPKLLTLNQSDDVDKNAIYMSDNPDLNKTNPKFKDFILIAKYGIPARYIWTYFAVSYAYVHKDKL